MIPTPNPINRLVAIDLFAGAGGMSLGFEQAGFDVLVALDHDPVHLGVHSYNFPNTQSLCADIQTVQPGHIRKLIRKAWKQSERPGEWDGTIDCIFGGPSCQGFSYIGSNSEHDDRNQLVFEFARIVSQLRPRSFVIENVPGLLGPRYRSTLSDLLGSLRQSNYIILNDYPVMLNAADYGVPQVRKRVFIIGVRRGESLPTLPTPLRFGPTVSDAIDDIPARTSFSSEGHGDRLYISNHLRDLPPYVRSLRSPYRYEYRRKWNSTLLTACYETTHASDIVRRFQNLAGNAVDPISRFQRLDGKGEVRPYGQGRGGTTEALRRRGQSITRCRG